MEETDITDLKTEVEQASQMVEKIIVQLIHETILRIELNEPNNVATKATQTSYMGNASHRDRNRLIDNANKRESTLTEEAKDARIVELNVEVAKRMETIGSLEQKVFGMRKVIEHLEIKFIERDCEPKERDYLTIS